MSLTPKLQKFSTASPAIVSYNFTEFASGKGIVIFYPADTDDENVISTSIFFAEDGSSSLDAEAGEGETREFITTLERPVTIEGKAIINQPVVVDNFSANTETVTINLTMSIIKRTTTGDTELLSVNNTLTAGLPTNTASTKVFSQSADISRVHLAAGDKIVYKYVATTSGTSSTGNSTAVIYFDPKDSKTHPRVTLISSQSAVHIPFVINI